MPKIRNYRQEEDLAALYRVCLETGDHGKDATHLYADPDVIGHIYAGQYGTLSPETALVIEDDQGVGGYIIGALDTHEFEKRLERDWWPGLRPKYPDPSGKSEKLWSAQERLQYLMHHPSRTPRRISEPFPSHLHIDLLPRLQGRGLGKKMLDAWLSRMRDLGSKGTHLGVSLANARAIRFYEAYGLLELERLPPPFNVVYFGTRLSRSS